VLAILLYSNQTRSSSLLSRRRESEQHVSSDFRSNTLSVWLVADGW
jgi:hypothetical protein